MMFELCPSPPVDAMCGCLIPGFARLSFAFDADNAQRSAETRSPWLTHNSSAVPFSQ